MKRGKTTVAALSDKTVTQIRFNEIDSMHVVWHGNYVRYFEDGRESFGKHYGLSYMDIYNAGYTVPIVKLNCEFKRSLVYGDAIVIETRFINSDAAKILFEYEIRKESDNSLVATGESMQVFLNKENEFELANPQFFLEWKARWGIK